MRVQLLSIAEVVAGINVETNEIDSAIMSRRVIIVVSFFCIFFILCALLGAENYVAIFMHFSEKTKLKKNDLKRLLAIDDLFYFFLFQTNPDLLDTSSSTSFP